MRKEVLEFLQFTDKVGLAKDDFTRERDYAIERFYASITEQYYTLKANEATLSMDIRALVSSHVNHFMNHYQMTESCKKISKEFEKLIDIPIINKIIPTNWKNDLEKKAEKLIEKSCKFHRVQTKSDHFRALMDIERIMFNLIRDAKQLGIVLPESEIQEHDYDGLFTISALLPNLNPETITIGDAIREIYSTPQPEQASTAKDKKPTITFTDEMKSKFEEFLKPERSIGKEAKEQFFVELKKEIEAADQSKKHGNIAYTIKHSKLVKPEISNDRYKFSTFYRKYCEIIGWKYSKDIKPNKCERKINPFLNGR